MKVSMIQGISNRRGGGIYKSVPSAHGSERGDRLRGE